MLAGERLALNLIGRLSGIATLTRRYVDAVGGTGVEILDTRKTTPGLRALEKHAVECGGGTNHRAGLYDAILIKDNHLRLAGGVATAVRRARENGNGLPIEVEAETLAQVQEAIDAGADTILLDNMTPDELRDGRRPDRRPREARSLRRRDARHRARRRRDRRRLRLRRRAHALRPLARRLSGGAL